MSDEIAAAGLHDLEDLEDLFEHAPCGYISAQANGRILKANRTFADWLGHPREELIGRRFQDFLNIAGKIYYETHFAPLLRMQGFFNEVALDLVRADGKTFPTLVNAVERRDEQDKLRFIRITIFNAADRRRYEQELLATRRAAEEANAKLQELNQTLEARVAAEVEERLKTESVLRQAQKMEAVGQLTGGIAHDFNNMLAIIISGISLLERQLASGNQNVAKYINAVKEGANRAAGLTQRLLAFSRQQALSPSPLDVNAMVTDMCELLHRTLGETVRLETALADNVWTICADANQLENAVVNLAVNARDAMPEGGQLTIETTNCHFDDCDAARHAVLPGDYVMIAVVDTGTGMPPEVISKAFEPFFTTKGVGKGTGLGLSQVFGFVKQSGGHVRIESEVGRGTAVRIYLPRLEGNEAVALRPAEEAAALGREDEIVLIVEDDEQVLGMTAQMVRELGYGVLTARSGAEALTVLRRHPKAGLLFTDVVMPDMNGRQLSNRARQLRPDIRVLFTTGYTRDAIIHNGVLDSDVTLLPKPATLHQLAAKLRAAFDGS